MSRATWMEQEVKSRKSKVPKVNSREDGNQDLVRFRTWFEASLPVRIDIGTPAGL